MNFPINTNYQRSVLKRAKEKTQDPIRRKWLQLEIEELYKIDENVQRREFFLMYFGKDKNELLKNRNTILSILGGGMNSLAEEISKEKKFQIEKKLCNMNTAILAGDFEEGEEDEI